MDMRSKGVQIDEFLELTDSGVGSRMALDLVYEMSELDEREDIAEADYWRLCVKSSSNEGVQMALMGSHMSDSAFKKLTLAYNLGISPDMYVSYHEIREKYDADGNGAYTNAEIKSVIDALEGDYTDEQKGVLWQMMTGSKSTKNNPYSKSAGQSWLDAKAEKG